MHIPANAIQAVTLMALISGFFQHGKKDGWLVASHMGRWAVTLMLLAMLVFMTWQAWIRTKEIFWLAQADRLGSCSNAQIKALQRAMQAEPADAEIPHRIGACYRARSWQGGEDYKDLSREAMIWFDRSRQLDPFDPYNYAYYGMCLDWIGESGKAEGYLKRAHELDPNGYFITALVGWHYLNAEDYAESKKWLERSIQLYSADNFIARFYLQHVDKRLAEKKTGS
jgi:tetratricopeptide (TPR) repeat protein